MAASAVTTTKGSGSSCTSINVSEFTYEWVIERFKLLLKENGERISSPRFRTNNTEIEWDLSLFPQGYCTQDAGYVSIHLHPFHLSEKAKTKKIRAQVEISLPRFGKTRTFVDECVSTDGYGYSKIMLRSKLLDLCGPNDTFTVRCKIQVPCEISTIDTAQCVEQVCDTQAGQLSQDFRSQADRTRPKCGNTSGVQKPPPLTTLGKGLKEIGVLLTASSQEVKDNFYLRQSISDNKELIYVTIFPREMNIYYKIKEILQSNKIEFYSYTPKNEKLKTIVLKNLFGNYTEEEVYTELKNLDWKNVEIIKVTKTAFSKYKIPAFLVQTSNTSDIKELINVKILLYQRVSWEPLRKKDVFQCTNCQRLGHASSNCALAFRCVKCGENHEPEQCKIDKNSDRQLLKCANCEQAGHPASYRGCPYFKYAQNIVKNNDKIANQQREARANSFHNRITPSVTFADANNIRTNEYVKRENIAPDNKILSPRGSRSRLIPSSLSHHGQPITDMNENIPAWAETLQQNIIEAISKIFLKNS